MPDSSVTSAAAAIAGRTPPTNRVGLSEAAVRRTAPLSTLPTMEGGASEQSDNMEQRAAEFVAKLGGRTYPDAELERHIQDCNDLFLAAYRRFEEHGLPSDRDEAVLWLHRRDAAILARSQEVQARRQAEFERQLDEGVGFFIDAGDRDRVIVLGRRAAP